MPEPSDGSQVTPSSSENESRLVTPSSCDWKMRPVYGSPTRIGSSDVTLHGEDTSSQVDTPGLFSSSVTLYVVRPDMKNTSPVRGSMPSVGSPEPLPTPSDRKSTLLNSSHVSESR